MCNNVRKLNDKTILQTISHVEHELCVSGQRQCKYFSIINLSDSYRQIQLSTPSQQIATISMIVGYFTPTTCIFGLKNLPFVFAKLMDSVFSLIRGIFMDFFIDDIIICSLTFDQHIQHIEQVMRRLQEAQLTAKPVKNIFV